jgi:NAD-dependent dihydropyrimidine dehydrogenase PreA subunit
MPKKRKTSKPSSVDFFRLLTETDDSEKKKRRKELLAPLGVEEFFAEGRITINKRTCEGVGCKLCIKACPTNALYWKAGEVGITDELCIYCGSCVLNCIVDDCIEIKRRRSTGEVESFSKPEDFMTLQNKINARKRYERIKEVFPKPKDYLNHFNQRKQKPRKKADA